MLKPRFKIAIIIGLFAAALLYSYSKRIAPNLQYGSVFYQMGVECENKCSARKQLGYFKKAIYHHSSIADAHYRMGLNYRTLKEDQKALESFKKAANADSDHVLAFQNAGIMYFEQNQFEEARKYLGHILHLNKHYPQAHYFLGKICEFDEEYKKAIFHYQRAYRYDHENAFPDSAIRVVVLGKYLEDDFIIKRQIGKLYHHPEKRELARGLESFVQNTAHGNKVIKQRIDDVVNQVQFK